MTLLIGADPEVFVRDGDRFTSAHVLKCGTKKKPKKTKHGSVQVDGLALEFNTIPTDDSKKFVQNVRLLLEDLNVIVKKRFPAGQIVAQPVAEFGFEYLDKLPLEAKELGCEPDFNAYTGKPNPRPNGFVPFRTGSGHIHLGWGTFKNDDDHRMTCDSLAKELDFWLGLPSLDWDKDNKRRELYGKAGTYRPKPYGMEYRTLSNAWLNDDTTMDFVFHQAKKGFENWQSGYPLHMEFGNFAQQVIDGNIVGWQDKEPDLAAIVYGG